MLNLTVECMTIECVCMGFCAAHVWLCSQMCVFPHRWEETRSQHELHQKLNSSRSRITPTSAMYSPPFYLVSSAPLYTLPRTDVCILSNFIQEPLFTQAVPCACRMRSRFDLRESASFEVENDFFCPGFGEEPRSCRPINRLTPAQ